ncbi:MAG: hypothetical protein AABZ55_05230 [Bdellovibrionota bacterium]
MGKKDIHFEILPFCENPEDNTMTEAVRARRVPRIDIRYSRPSIYFGYAGLTKTDFPIQTLAELGAGVYLGSQINRQVTPRIPSYLKIGQIMIPIKSRMVYLSQGVAGVEFLEPSRETRAAIQSHFHLEFAAAMLQPAFESRDYNSPIQRLIFKGKTNNYGFEFTSKSGRICSLNATLDHLGMASWIEGRPLTMSTNLSTQSEVETVRAQLASFIKNISGINPRYQAQIMEIINMNPIDFDYDTRT